MRVLHVCMENMDYEFKYVDSTEMMMWATQPLFEQTVLKLIYLKEKTQISGCHKSSTLILFQF